MLIGLAALPILTIFILLFLLRKSAVKAGVTAYIVTVSLVNIIPQFFLDLSPILNSTIKGVLISSIVAYVLFFGIFLFHLMNEIGLIKSIAAFISNATSDKDRQVLILVVAFSPLVESISGFGIAIIVVAPILVELGFDRFKAALLSLVSLSAVPWGALATGTVIAANLSGISLPNLGAGSAILAIPTFLYFGFIAVYLAGGIRAVKEKWFEVLTISGTLSASIWFFSKYISVELAGVLGALVAITLVLIFIKLAPKQANLLIGKTITSSKTLSSRHNIIKAVSPYLFLTGLLLASRLIPPLEYFLSSNAVVELSNYSFKIPLLYSPGFFILLTSLFTIFLFEIKSHVIMTSLRVTIKQWLPVTLSTILFVAVSEIMFSAGMTRVLANVAAFTFGPAFIYLSPIIGGLGGFLTGSNAGANAMLINLQVQTAYQLGINPEIFAYGQVTSASHMTMASPTRVLLGVTVCDLKAEENRLLRQVFLIAIGSLTLLLLGMLNLFK